MCRLRGNGLSRGGGFGQAIREMTGRPPAEAGPEVIARTGTLGRPGGRVGVESLDLDLTVIAGFGGARIRSSVLRGGIGGVGAKRRLAFSQGPRSNRAGLGSEGPLIGAGAVAWRAAGANVSGAEWDRLTGACRDS